MINTQTPNLNKQSKDKFILTQKQNIFIYLSKKVATATMVSKATKIPQKNICRYKKDLEKQGLLMELEKKTCKVTGFKAWYLTTNPELFNKKVTNQLNIF